MFRAYDDGVAFRYVLPEQPGLGAFRLAAERTEFRFAGNHTAWAASYGSFTTSQEKEFDKTTLGAHHAGVDRRPAAAGAAGADAYVAITESDLRDWAGMYLAGHGAAPNTLVSTLSPRPDDPGVVVVAKTPHASPWRVLMIADHPGRLVESNLVANLATPLQLKDTSWIKPGRSAWDRWWSGDWAPGADFKVGMNTATMKYFTDLAAEMGWEYVLVDWAWYGPITDFKTGGERDCTKPVAAVDVPEIVRYAKAKSVKVVVWVYWRHLDQRLDEALALYEKWGVAGIKVDFMDRDDQWMVNWYETVGEEGGRAPPDRRLPRRDEAHRPRARLPEPPHARRRPRKRVQQVERPGDPGAQGHPALHAHARGADGLHARRLPARHEVRLQGPGFPLVLGNRFPQSP